MSILRLTLNAWRSLGSNMSAGLPVGKSVLPVYVKIIPTLTASSVKDQIGIIHARTKEYITIDAWPFSYDLVDPIDSTPNEWGYQVEIVSKAGEKVVINLTSEVLSNIPLENTIRRVRLEDYMVL